MGRVTRKRGYCSGCGRPATLRFVKGRGWVCRFCIKDDDLVKCVKCGDFKEWSTYPIHRQWMGGLVKYHTCSDCHRPMSKKGYAYCDQCGKKTCVRLVEGVGILCYRCLVKLGDDVNVFCEGCGEFKPFTGFPVFRETRGILLRRRICIDCSMKGIKKRFNPLEYGVEEILEVEEAPADEDKTVITGIEGVTVKDRVARMDIRFAVHLIESPPTGDKFLMGVRDKILSGDFMLMRKE